VTDPASGRGTALVLVAVAIALFVLLWLTIDSNLFSSVRGSP
jgi:hypothetical protein